MISWGRTMSLGRIGALLAGTHLSAFQDMPSEQWGHPNITMSQPELTSLTSFRNENGSSDDFFSFFFPWARCSAAVRKVDVVTVPPEPFFFEVSFGTCFFALAGVFRAASSSSPSPSLSVLRSSDEREEQDEDRRR